MPAQNSGAIGTAVATVTGGNSTSADSTAIFQELSGMPDMVRAVTKGESAMGIAGAAFSTFGSPVNNAADTIAFSAKVVGGGVQTTDDQGIWSRTAAGVLTLVAREGAEPPDGPAGAKWKAFKSLALPGGTAGPLFTATLLKDAGGITSIDDFAFYRVDSTGVARELVRENQPLLGRVVKSFTVLKPVVGSPAQTRAFNDEGEIVLNVAFTDGISAILRITVP